jgi:hypothetical protein
MAGSKAVLTAELMVALTVAKLAERSVDKKVHLMVLSTAAQKADKLAAWRGSKTVVLTAVSLAVNWVVSMESLTAATRVERLVASMAEVTAYLTAESKAV